MSAAKSGRQESKEKCGGREEHRMEKATTTLIPSELGGPILPVLTTPPSAASKFLFNHLAASLLGHIERELMNDTTCEEILRKEDDTHTSNAAIRGAVDHLRKTLADASRQAVEEAFFHFDKDGSKTIDQSEIEAFLVDYCKWMMSHHWMILQRPRLECMVKVMASTLCKHIHRLDLRPAVDTAFAEVINFEDFKAASHKDVSRMHAAIRSTKATLAAELLERCDKDADGVLDFKEFSLCTNLDLLQSLGRVSNSSEFSELWKAKSKLLALQFENVVRSHPPHSTTLQSHRTVDTSCDIPACFNACVCS